MADSGRDGHDGRDEVTDRGVPGDAVRGAAAEGDPAAGNLAAGDSAAGTPAAGDPAGSDPDAGPAPRRNRTSLVAALALTGLLGLYVWLVAGRAVALVRTGEPVGVALGIAFAVLPLLVLVLVAREWLLAVDVQRMADTLATRGELPVDDLPRSPGGRIDRAAAAAAFDRARVDAESAAADDWGAWYRLAFAYDAAGDRRRARATLRHASRLHRGRTGEPRGLG